MFYLLSNTSGARAHADDVEVDLSGRIGESSMSLPETGEEKGAAGEAIPRPMPGSGQVGDSAEVHVRRGLDLLELTMHIAALEEQIDLASRSLLASAEPLWQDYWDAGAYEVVKVMGPDFMSAPDGRPKPMQIKQVGNETRVVVLPEDLYPEVWSALENLSSLNSEHKALEYEIKRIRGEVVAPTK